MWSLIFERFQKSASSTSHRLSMCQVVRNCFHQNFLSFVTISVFFVVFFWHSDFFFIIFIKNFCRQNEFTSHFCIFTKYFHNIWFLMTTLFYYNFFVPLFSSHFFNSKIFIMKLFHHKTLYPHISVRKIQNCQKTL